MKSGRLLLAAWAVAAGGRAGAWPWPAGEVTLAAVGDVMLDRGVAAAIARSGADFPFRDTAAGLGAADLAFANLECPLAECSERLPKPIAFRGAPGGADALARAGFDVVSLANNHAVDCGRAGLVETMENLGRARVGWCGAGRTRRAAEAPLIVRRRGLRIAFVAFSEFPEGARKTYEVPTIALAEEATVAAGVAAARRAADVVVASFHWGEEYRAAPVPAQRRLAAVAAAAGADLVLGHHPHVWEGLAWIPRPGRPGARPCLVAYSLGNFVFDQRLRPATAESAVLRCRLGRDGVRAAALEPVAIVRGQPRAATGRAGAGILRRIAALSLALGARVAGAAVSCPGAAPAQGTPAGGTPVGGTPAGVPAGS